MENFIDISNDGKYFHFTILPWMRHLISYEWLESLIPNVFSKYVQVQDENCLDSSELAVLLNETEAVWDKLKFITHYGGYDLLVINTPENVKVYYTIVAKILGLNLSFQEQTNSRVIEYRAFGKLHHMCETICRNYHPRYYYLDENFQEDFKCSQSGSDDDYYDDESEEYYYDLGSEEYYEEEELENSESEYQQ